MSTFSPEWIWKCRLWDVGQQWAVYRVVPAWCNHRNQQDNYPLEIAIMPLLWYFSYSGCYGVGECDFSWSWGGGSCWSSSGPHTDEQRRSTTRWKGYLKTNNVLHVHKVSVELSLWLSGFEYFEFVSWFEIWEEVSVIAQDLWKLKVDLLLVITKKGKFQKQNIESHCENRHLISNITRHRISRSRVRPGYTSEARGWQSGTAASAKPRLTRFGGQTSTLQ